MSLCYHKPCDAVDFRFLIFFICRLLNIVRPTTSSFSCHCRRQISPAPLQECELCNVSTPHYAKQLLFVVPDAHLSNWTTTKLGWSSLPGVDTHKRSFRDWLLEVPFWKVLEAAWSTWRKCDFATNVMVQCVIRIIRFPVWNYNCHLLLSFLLLTVCLFISNLGLIFFAISVADYCNQKYCKIPSYQYTAIVQFLLVSEHRKIWWVVILYGNFGYVLLNPFGIRIMFVRVETIFWFYKEIR